MTAGSLRLRLLVAGAASILIALALAGAGLLALFERHVERRVVLELQADLRQLAAGLDRGAGGELEVRTAPAEPRFAAPLSGLYWQIAPAEGKLLRSRSLWDAVLLLPLDRLGDGDVHQHALAGPLGASLLVVERSVALPERLGGERVRVAVAIDRADILAATWSFAADLAFALPLLAAVLIAAAWAQVRVGLRPLDVLRRRLALVRDGHAARLGVAFPDEVRPLASELDHLLDLQEHAIARARTRAADLAHGLKTPLTVLDGTAEALRARGEAAAADEIADVAGAMHRHIERELARARAGAGRATVALPLRPVAERVLGVVRRTPRGQDLVWTLTLPEGLAAAVQADDFAEMLGNLAENAGKWATGEVWLSARATAEGVLVAVEDDGPGIAEADRDAALRRGMRLDQGRPGSGLGLAIVSDLAEACGGTLRLEQASAGGLRAVLVLPADH